RVAELGMRASPVRERHRDRQRLMTVAPVHRFPAEKRERRVEAPVRAVAVAVLAPGKAGIQAGGDPKRSVVRGVGGALARLRRITRRPRQSDPPPRLTPEQRYPPPPPCLP